MSFEVFIDCDNKGCDSQQQVFDDQLPDGWEDRNGQSYCPHCVWVIGLVHAVADGTLSVDQAVEKLLGIEGAPA